MGMRVSQAPLLTPLIRNDHLARANASLASAREGPRTAHSRSLACRNSQKPTYLMRRRHPHRFAEVAGGERACSCRLACVLAAAPDVLFAGRMAALDAVPLQLDTVPLQLVPAGSRPMAIPWSQGAVQWAEYPWSWEARSPKVSVRHPVPGWTSCFLLATLISTSSAAMSVAILGSTPWNARPLRCADVLGLQSSPDQLHDCNALSAVTAKAVVNIARQPAQALAQAARGELCRPGQNEVAKTYLHGRIAVATCWDPRVEDAARFHEDPKEIEA